MHYTMGLIDRQNEIKLDETREFLWQSSILQRAKKNRQFAETTWHFPRLTLTAY